MFIVYRYIAKSAMSLKANISKCRTYKNVSNYWYSDAYDKLYQQLRKQIENQVGQIFQKRVVNIFVANFG